MNCCETCFNDTELKNLINSNGIIGVCDFCNAVDVKVLDTLELSDYFELLISNYEPSSSPSSASSDLYDVLQNHWNLFNTNKEVANSLMAAILPSRINGDPEFLSTPMDIPQFEDKTYLEGNSLLNGINWIDFVGEIKHENRFHLSNQLNLSLLEEYINIFSKVIKTGEKFYRARISSRRDPFPISEMGAPPREINLPNRLNPEGISYLYLSKEPQTTIYEVRARLFDYVSIGTFENNQSIRIIDLTSIDRISPFLLSNDIVRFAVNKRDISIINQEMRKPISSRESKLDYLPTQYFAEAIKNMGYDGIKYASTLDSNGINFTLFNEAKCQCYEVHSYEVTSLEYEYN